MEEYKLSDDVFERIKDFNHMYLTKEPKLLIDKLILNEELKQHYKYYGLCKECKQPNTNGLCKPCCSKHFQQNFKNWTSGNHEVDMFIQKAQLEATNKFEILEWIEYDRFENVEYLSKGGFGTIYKAIWKDGYISHWDFEGDQWKRSKTWYHNHEKFPVVLKCLHNSKDITADFLREIELHTMHDIKTVIRCFGITKDPKSNDFMMVMLYADKGSLRQHLNNNFNSMNWKIKLNILQQIAESLDKIHNNGLVHRDFHCGNILNCSLPASKHLVTFITDLGLCQPANTVPSQNENKQVYGVLPYVAPEVLRGKKYTQESDIYGFGIIAYEICTGLPPYHDIPHDEFLAINICQGLRPKSNYKIPQLILDIIKQCWDADPLKRPKAAELYSLLRNLHDELDYSDDDDDTDERSNDSSVISEFQKQIKEAEKINKKFTSNSLLHNGATLSYTTNPQAVYTSRLLNFKNLPEPKNAIDNKDNNSSFEVYTDSIESIDFTKLVLAE